MSPDVLVIGAGPAGATAARTLALSGARVRLLDRARFPRNKPCGGAISMRVLRRFPHLVAAIARISHARLSRLHLESPSGRSVLVESTTPAALMIRRVEYDALLTRLAVEAGVELVEGVEITQAEESPAGVSLRARDGRRFLAPLAIAADGVYSVVARRLGLNQGWRAGALALDMMEETPSETLRSAEPDTLWVAYGYGGDEGYAYVFPKEAHVNVGIGYVLDYFRSRVAETPYRRQAAFVEMLCRRGVLSGHSSKTHFTPYQIPVGGVLARTASNRVLVAGDAGGFVNGITAEGIYYAMVSGELAAQALTGRGPQEYPRMWGAEIGAELRDAVLVQRDLLKEPPRIDAAVGAAQSSHALATRLIAYLMGEVSYASARRNLLLTAPAFVARLLVHRLHRKAHAHS